MVAKDTRETESMVEGSYMGGAETTGIGTGALLGGLFGGAGRLAGRHRRLAIPGIGPIVAAGAWPPRSAARPLAPRLVA